jgi:hypothetical protein
MISGGKMEIFGNLLRYFTIYVVYPVIVIGLFFFLGYSIYNLIKHSREGERLRRIAGALLPIVILVFALVLIAQKDLGMSGLYSSLNSFWGFIGGLFIGVIVIAFGNYMKEFEIEILPPLFTFFLSLITVFILYSIMQFKLGALNYFLMGMLIGGAIIIIWKGIPDALLPERYNPWTVKGDELHKNIAKEYLSREVGLSTSEVEHLIENTGFFPFLTAGNYVFNYYLNGVYFSAVTRGDASVAPEETLSANQDKQLNDSKDVSADKSSVLVTQGDASVTPRETFPADEGKQPTDSEDASDDESSEFKKMEW